MSGCRFLEAGTQERGLLPVMLAIGLPRRSSSWCHTKRALPSAPRRPRPWVESTDGQKSQGLTHAAMTRMRYDWSIVGDVAQTAKLEYETGRKSLSSRPASVSARCDASSLPASVNASHPFTAPCRIF